GWTAEGDEHRDVAAVTPADEMGGSADEFVDDRDGLGGHVVVMEWRVCVGGASVPAAVESDHPETVGEPRLERIQQQLAVAQAAVEQEDRLTGSTRVREPRAMAADIGVSARPSLRRGCHMGTGASSLALMA